MQGERVKLEVESQRTLTPSDVTLIDGADLYSRNIASLADMLCYVPGVWATAVLAQKQFCVVTAPEVAILSLVEPRSFYIGAILQF